MTFTSLDAPPETQLRQGRPRFGTTKTDFTWEWISELKAVSQAINFQNHQLEIPSGLQISLHSCLEAFVGTCVQPPPRRLMLPGSMGGGRRWDI